MPWSCLHCFLQNQRSGLSERGARGSAPQAFFKGRVIGAPVAMANIPQEALSAGLQSLKLSPPLPSSPPPSQLLLLTPMGFWSCQGWACQQPWGPVAAGPGRGEKSSNYSSHLWSADQEPGMWNILFLTLATALQRQYCQPHCTEEETKV